MDAGLVGGLIGIGVMVCVICTGVLHEKGGMYIRKLKENYQKYKQQHQPLLPFTLYKENPLLVRSSFKQFQMKDLLQQK